MAEFQEVMKQAKRMCEAMDECDDCPLCDILYACGGDKRIDCIASICMSEVEVVEHAVMDWAAKHPEPRYPSWNEWRDANFPGVEGIIAPCAFISKKEMMRINGTRCELIPCRRCANNPIPADIAEKLGIKPIGGNADA